MKSVLAISVLALSSIAAHAEYQQVNMTVFGMDCAPCAHAIHVSMKGIQGVNKVDVDLNTGLVAIQLTPGNNAGIRQFQSGRREEWLHPQRCESYRSRKSHWHGCSAFP